MSIATQHITITLNGKSCQIASHSSLIDVLTRQGINNNNAIPFAVAVNHTFIPKEEYTKIQLKLGDSIEIVTPMQGG